MILYLLLLYGFLGLLIIVSIVAYLIYRFGDTAVVIVVIIICLALFSLIGGRI